MRQVLLALALIGALALAVPGAPAVPGTVAPSEVRVVAVDNDTRHYAVPDVETRNPTLRLARDRSHDVTLENPAPGDAHALWFGMPIAKGTGTVPPGDSVSFRVRVPEDAPEATQYWCTIHPEEMRGILVFTNVTEDAVTQPEVGAEVAGAGAGAALSAVLTGGLLARKRTSR